MRGLLWISISALWIASCASPGPAGDAGADSTDDAPLLFRKSTEVLHSDIVGADYKLHVSLPADYMRTSHAYPVLYCMDADRSFGMVSDLVNALSFPMKQIPLMIVVGIGYPIEGLEEWAAWRHRDYTPSTDTARSRNWQRTLRELSGRSDLEVMSGGAARFLRFMREELIPYIEKRYRADPQNRCLAGYSLGGLFTLYALFHAQGTFQRFLAGSPSLWWDDGTLFEDEAVFAAARDDLPARVFMSVGGQETERMISGMKRMEERLRSRCYPSLELHTQMYDMENHQTAYPCALTHGLRTLFAEE